MRVEDLEKMNWREDSDYLDAERKLHRLREREAQARARLTELERTVKESQEALVQLRVSLLLEEGSDEQGGKIQQQLKAQQEEITEVRLQIDATKLAEQKLATAVQDAASQAKSRLVEKLRGPYLDTAQELLELIDAAVELNSLLDAIHLKVTRDNLTRDKPLAMAASWDILRPIKGGALEYWRTRHDAVFSQR